MRILLALFLACCSPTAPTDSGVSQLEVASDVSARDLLQTMFIDNGALAVSARRGFVASGAQIWRGWANDAGFATISTARREAIRRYLVEDYPREATDEVMSGAPQVLDAAAPRASAQLSGVQIARLNAFLESEEGRTWFVAAMSSGETEYAPSAAESRALDQLAAQTNGQVWTEEFNQLIYQIASDVISSRAAAVRHRLFTRVCELAGDECPPGFVPDP